MFKYLLISTMFIATAWGTESYSFKYSKTGSWEIKEIFNSLRLPTQKNNGGFREIRESKSFVSRDNHVSISVSQEGEQFYLLQVNIDLSAYVDTTFVHGNLILVYLPEDVSAELGAILPLDESKEIPVRLVAPNKEFEIACLPKVSPYCLFYYGIEE